jgi:hypothetical protein
VVAAGVAVEVGVGFGLAGAATVVVGVADGALTGGGAAHVAISAPRNETATSDLILTWCMRLATRDVVAVR